MISCFVIKRIEFINLLRILHESLFHFSIPSNMNSFDFLAVVYNLDKQVHFRMFSFKKFA